MIFRVALLTVSLLLAAITQADDSPVVSDSNNCPADFYQVPVMTEGKLCNLFAPELPASMSYFVADSPSAVKAYYLNQYGEPDSEQLVKGRILLTYAQGQRTIIISNDGAGSQIDILVKAA